MAAIRCWRGVRGAGDLVRVPPELRPGERAIKTYRANRTQGSRSVGGHLLSTDQRAVFYSHRLDAATGGVGWECELASISSVHIAPRGRNPFDGSMRRRLQIDCGGAAEYVVMNNVGSIVAAIGEAAER